MLPSHARFSNSISAGLLFMSITMDDSRSSHDHPASTFPWVSLSPWWTCLAAVEALRLLISHSLVSLLYQQTSTCYLPLPKTETKKKRVHESLRVPGLLGVIIHHFEAKGSLRPYACHDNVDRDTDLSPRGMNGFSSIHAWWCGLSRMHTDRYY
jgi:hypothetical protein